MRGTQLFSVFFILLFTYSCKNDIEINAPWQETPVVYAFIDPNTSTQVFRIQKTYQNSISQTTAEGAQINDSLYFDTLIVKVIVGSKTYTFQKVQNLSKDPGFFAKNAHILYECPGFKGISGQTYFLSIFSPKTGKTYSSSTRCVGPSNMTALKLNFNATNPFSGSTITTSISDGSATYSQSMRLVYYEYPKGGTTGDTLFADFNLDPNLQPYTSSGNFRIQTNVYVNALKAIIPDKPNVERKVVRIDFINVGGAKELADLIDLNKPSISVTQKKVDYSNITDGLGIFSSRSYKYDTGIERLTPQAIADWPAQKQLLINALNALDFNGIVSKNLQFVL
jgi:hypothetical protein